MSKTIPASDIIVIGAGAAGLMAAGCAAESGAKVVLIERMSQAGRKILITGKGRCNITNTAPLSEFLSHVHPSGNFLRPAFSMFFSEEMISHLNRHGLQTLTERGNRVFPKGNKAADVVKALTSWLGKNKLDFIKDARVKELMFNNDSVTGVIYEKEGETIEIRAKSIIVCTGGKSYPATGSSGDGYNFAEQAGHSIIPLRQSLVPLVTVGETASKLQGLSLKNVNVSLWINDKKATSEFGEMLFTHFGLSGPIILTLSRMAVDALSSNSKVEISIDLKPALDEQKLDLRLVRDLNENGKKTIGTIFKQWLPSSLIPVFMEQLKLDSSKECHQLNAKDRKKIMLLMKNFRFKISSPRSFKEAIVTAGGINTSEVDKNTMESKIVKNLYFAGEVLDLDGDTGGYNLQIAWSTGWLAGKSAAKKVMV